MSLLSKIIDLCFPRYCTVCGNRLVGTEETICTYCRLHLPYTDTWENPYENEMAKQFWARIPIERCAALIYYQRHSLPSNLIYNLKYNDSPDIGIHLGKTIAERGLQKPPTAENHFFEGIDALIPIPITPKRRRERGYNQSEKIAEGISQLTNIPIITDAVARTSFHESQTSKNRWQRNLNVEGAFRLSPFYHDAEGKHPISQLAGKHLLIVDDVCTTGATIISCCKTLQQTGKMKFSITTIGWAKA